MYQLTMLAVPHLINSRGNVVNVSSVNGIRPVSLAFPSTDGVGCTRRGNFQMCLKLKRTFCIKPFLFYFSLQMYWPIICLKLPSTNLLKV